MKKDIPKLFTFEEIKELFGISRSSLERWEKSGNFPKRIRLGQNKIRWLSSEIYKWIENKQKQR